jgi:2-amino-4-hydroxy-6-hydroxymethyldihydropteridine diphosphokinase
VPQSFVTTAYTAYIGLGSNLASAAGTPAETITAAVGRLGALGDIIAVSSLYETEPVGYARQPRFVNAASVMSTQLGPLELLGELLSIEREFGRERGQTQPKGPRTLDLDLLMMDDLIFDSPVLTLPHPAMAERRFVLAPLAEIAAEVQHPVSRKTIARLLAELPDTGENRIAAVRIT